MRRVAARARVLRRGVLGRAVLGRVVALQDEQGALVHGIVSAVQVEAGTPKLIVNGQAYDLSTLLSVEPATANP